MEYQKQGYILTLRQLYYRLVSRNIIKNNQSEYKRISKILTKGRMAGIVDWDAIEDRIRVPYRPYWCRNVQWAIEDTIKQYRLDRQAGQEVYVEVWIEKDALSGVIKPVTAKYGIPLVVNRGYSSCSAMYEAAKRIKYKIEFCGVKQCIIFYIGDHDPSGLDMDRDIGDRLQEFGVYPDVIRIALTGDQIKLYEPPENRLKKDDYGKLKDPRGKAYFEEFGNVSWEVDALTPETLDSLLRRHIENAIDMPTYHKVLRQEGDDKMTLYELIEKM